MSARAKAVVLGLSAAACLLAATRIGFAADLLPGWQPVTADLLSVPLPNNVSMSQSPDRRCSLAITKTTDRVSKREAIETALTSALTERGFTIDMTKKRGRLERGVVRGMFVVEISDGSVGAGSKSQNSSPNKSWELRACIYQKRDENVCQSSCNKLL